MTSSMESLYSVLSFTAAKFHRSTLSPMTSFGTNSKSFSVSAMASSQKIATTTTTVKRSAKVTKRLSTESSDTVPFPKKKVLVPIGFGTEEMEAVIIIDVLRRAGADVTVASVESELVVEASCGTKLVADTSISNCSDKIFDLVALPGGMPGSVRLRDCKILKEITCKQAEEKRLYGAICAAPAVTLLPWGLTSKKQTTCHPAFMEKLPTFWAVKSNIYVSKGLTTSRGPGTSFEFALCLVEQLLGESVATELGELLMISTEGNELRKEEYNNVEWSLDHHPRVLIPIANGSEEVEVVTVADILRRAKVDVVVAAVGKSTKILGSRGTKIIADKLIGDVSESIYDLIVLPGGFSGTERLNKSRVLKKLLKEQKLAGRFYGAVCSSPQILHSQGLLKDMKAVAYPSIAGDPKVIIDGKLITSKGLSTVTEFALAIISKLFGHGRARSVAEGLVYEYPKS